MLYGLLVIIFTIMISLISIYLKINSLKKKKLLYDIDETRKVIRETLRFIEENCK